MIRFLLACSAIGLSACHSTSARKFLDRAVAGMPQVPAPAEISRLAARKTFQAWSFDGPLTPKASGSLGMGVLISKDGYALTAAHVVSHGDGGFLRSEENDVSGKSIAELRQSAAFTGSLSDRELKQMPAKSTIFVSPFRVVRIFKGVDLALIKTSLRPTKWFELASGMPKEGAVIYVTRNPINHGGPTTLQGMAQMPTRMASPNEKTWWFDSNVPVTQGDSGGPAFDETGKLLGCVSVVNLWRLPFSRLSGNRWTSVVGTESGEIQQAIAADQARLRKNLAAVYNDKALLKEIEAITGAKRNKVQQLVEKLMSIKDGFSKR